MRARPHADIDLDAVGQAVARLFVEGFSAAVSIGNAAEKLDVSRAAPHRAVPTRYDLVGSLFERGTTGLNGCVMDIAESVASTD